jgi:hypothetical protein
MDQKIINLYDEYIHSATITRADFFKTSLHSLPAALPLHNLYYHK